VEGSGGLVSVCKGRPGGWEHIGVVAGGGTYRGQWRLERKGRPGEHVGRRRRQVEGGERGPSMAVARRGQQQWQQRGRRGWHVEGPAV